MENINDPWISKIGFKHAQSKKLESARILLIWTTIFLICMAIRKEAVNIPTINDISQQIRPGTIFYTALMEMDEDTRSRYIKSLQVAFNDNPLTKKYVRAIRIGLLSGLFTEFILNGNTAKPLGVVARTITYSILATLFG